VGLVSAKTKNFIARSTIKEDRKKNSALPDELVDGLFIETERAKVVY
jgi:hypothetical protein